MKKISVLLIAVIIGVCAVVFCACSSPPEFFSLVYISQEGGTVYGDLNQSVQKGGNGTQVVAVAHEGYEFVGWSDGVQTAARTESDVSEDLEVTAQFEKIVMRSLEYKSSEGNIVIGDYIQHIKDGQSGSIVTVKSNNGYRFVKWSDNNTDKIRKDAQVDKDISVTAISEKIVIEFYSDSYLVRRLNVVDINTADLDKLVGYKSESRFLGWEYKDEVSADKSHTLNTLYEIKRQYNLYGIFDIDNIRLQAVYEKQDNGSVPSNFITVSHALGGYNGKNYTNSKEAFEYNYGLGQRFFEVDLAFTSDRKIVTSHSSVQQTLDEFMNISERDYTPLTLSELINYIREYPTVYFDLDTLRWSEQQDFIDFSNALKQELEDDIDLIDRIIVEITPYNTELISILRQQVGLNNFLYTECWYIDDIDEFERVCKECSDLGVNFCSILASPRWITKEKVDICHRYGIYVMAYTVNSPTTMYDYYDIGVDCIFTDYIFM